MRGVQTFKDVVQRVASDDGWDQLRLEDLGGDQIVDKLVGLGFLVIARNERRQSRTSLLTGSSSGSAFEYERKCLVFLQ